MQPEDTRTIGILQPSYLPWIGFFEQLKRSDIFVIYDDVQFEKNSWRNRNRIKTPQGVQWLTVPVLTKGGGFQLIKDTKINNNSNWQKKHIKSITQNYNKANCFKDYSSSLFSILSEKWEYLIDLNIALINYINTILNIKTPIILSSSLKSKGSKTERLIKIINELQGNCFYEGASGKNYLDELLFKKNNIDLKYQHFLPESYNQLYGDFISHLSIIDLILNVGEKSYLYIKER